MMEGIYLPHITVEYTNNIQNEINISEILQGLNDSLISHKDLFSAKGIRSRAIKLTDYKVGDGLSNDAFIHVSLKVATGRTAAAKELVLGNLFKTLESHVKGALTKKDIALSLEISELNNDGNLYKQL